MKKKKLSKKEKEKLSIKSIKKMKDRMPTLKINKSFFFEKKRDSDEKMKDAREIEIIILIC